MGGGVFRCPSCTEFISASASTCRFCGVAVNVEEAQALTRKQTELDNAIGGARTIKVMGPTMLGLMLLTALLGWIYPAVLCAILEVMTVQWLFRFRKVRGPHLQRLRWLVWLYAVLGAVVAFLLGILLVVGIVLRVRAA